jgi:hypothetical protein
MEAIMACCTVLFQVLPEDRPTDEKDEEASVRLIVSGSRFIPEIFQILNRSANHTADTFGCMLHIGVNAKRGQTSMYRVSQKDVYTL